MNMVFNRSRCGLRDTEVKELAVKPMGLLFLSIVVTTVNSCWKRAKCPPEIFIKILHLIHLTIVWKKIFLKQDSLYLLQGMPLYELHQL